jgi:retron-type reverse transcriptase
LTVEKLVAVMLYDKRIWETLLKLENYRDDAQAAKLALELRKLLHEQVEQIRSAVLKLKKVRTGTTVWTVSLRRSDAGTASERCEPPDLS